MIFAALTQMENVATGAKAINLHLVFWIVFFIAGVLGTMAVMAVKNSQPIYFGLVWGGALIVALIVIASLYFNRQRYKANYNSRYKKAFENAQARIRTIHPNMKPINVNKVAKIEAKRIAKEFAERRAQMRKQEAYIRKNRT